MFFRFNPLPVFIAFIFAVTFQQKLTAQSSIKDSSIGVTLIGAHYTGSITGGDLTDRFGIFSEAGLSCIYKFRNNFMIGASYSYIFGTNVKETDMLDKIKTSSGGLINNQGMIEAVMPELRGFNVFIKGGKLFPIFGPNKNSGLFALLGGGLLQHKIYFNDDQGVIPQLEDEYLKGYDRLTNGFALTESIGYQHLSNQGFINFSIGFNLMQAFTQNRRDLNFDTMIKDSKSRMDLLYGLDIQIKIPIYKKAPGYYY